MFFVKLQARIMKLIALLILEKIVKLYIFQKKNSFLLKFNYFFLIKCLIFCIIKKPNNIIFFNQKSTYLIYLFKIFKKKLTKLIYHNFDYDLPSSHSSFKDRFIHQLEIFFSK